jgi:glycerophosphoryl diester phosphodiesterase
MMILVFFFSVVSAMASGSIEVQGHRGARWVRPENTLPAFQYALENGVDTLEMDMHVTKDDQIVITHDPYLNAEICVDSAGLRIRNKILVRSLTLTELRKFDCGSQVNQRFPEQKTFPKTRIPTLEEVFRMVENSVLPHAKKIQFNIETKSEGAHPDFTPAPEIFVKLFLHLVKKHKLLDRVTLQSLDYRTLRIAKKLEPKMKLSVLVENKMSADQIKTLMQDIGAQIFSPNYKWLTKDDVVAMHKIGVKVLPWTPNERKDWQKLMDFGVDGIITDNPKGLLEYLKR